jgi:amino acid transporter
MSAEDPALFTRQATGLVREGKTRDALFFNIMYSSVLLTVAFYFLLAPAFYQGSNFVVSALIAGLLGLPGGFLYAILTHMMPRTGGDYIFASRIINPVVGFMSNFSWMFWLAVVVGVYSTYFADYGAGAFFRMIAGYTGDTTMLDIGQWFSSEWGKFITGVAFVVFFAGVFIVGGTRTFFRMQRWNFILYIGGAFLLATIVALFTSETSFVNNFNDYVANLGTPGAADKVAESAMAAGYQEKGFDWEATLLAVSTAWYVFGFVYSSNYVAGEIRNSKRTHFYSIPGALLLGVAVIIIIVPAIQSMAGVDFLNMLGVADPAAYGMDGGVAAYPELIAIGSGSPIIGGIVIVGFVAGLMAFVAMAMMLLSRAILAWSFDGLMPRPLAEVDSRTHTPVRAVLVIAVFFIATTAIYSFTDWFSTLIVLLPQSLTLVVVAICGIILPWRRPELFESSGFNKRVAGVPVLTWVGGLSLLGFLGAITILLKDPASGTSISENLNMVLISLGAFLVVAPLIYLVAYLVRKRQGVDLGLVYREIPPE